MPTPPFPSGRHPRTFGRWAHSNPHTQCRAYYSDLLNESEVSLTHPYFLLPPPLQVRGLKSAFTFPAGCREDAETRTDRSNTKSLLTRQASGRRNRLTAPVQHKLSTTTPPPLSVTSSSPPARLAIGPPARLCRKCGLLQPGPFRPDRSRPGPSA